MANFNDPTVVEEDARAYTFPAMLCELGSMPSPLLIVAVSLLWHTVSGVYM